MLKAFWQLKGKKKGNAKVAPWRQFALNYFTRLQWTGEYLVYTLSWEHKSGGSLCRLLRCVPSMTYPSSSPTLATGWTTLVCNGLVQTWLEPTFWDGRLNKLKWFLGVGEMVQQLGTHTMLAENPSLVPSRQLVTSCNSTSRGSDTNCCLCRHLRPHAHSCHIDTHSWK